MIVLSWIDLFTNLFVIIMENIQNIESIEKKANFSLIDISENERSYKKCFHIKGVER